MEKLTYAMENYLEAIYELSAGESGVRVSDISERLGVTKASVNNAMATLANKGLVINEKYKEVLLTSAGLKQAKMTSKKHNTLLDFFTKILKVNEDIADKDACSIEHVISNDTINAMQKYLNNTKSINS